MGWVGLVQGPCGLGAETGMIMGVGFGIVGKTWCGSVTPGPVRDGLLENFSRWTLVEGLDDLDGVIDRYGRLWSVFFALSFGPQALDESKKNLAEALL